MTKSDYHNPDWPSGLYRRETGYFIWKRQKHGKRATKSLGTKNLSIACRKADELNRAVDEKEQSPLEAVNKDKVTFDDAAGQYIASKPLRETTVTRYSGQLKKFIEVAKELIGRSILLLSDIDNSLISRFIEHRTTEPSSLNGHLNSINVKQIRIGRQAAAVSCQPRCVVLGFHDRIYARIPSTFWDNTIISPGVRFSGR